MKILINAPTNHYIPNLETRCQIQPITCIHAQNNERLAHSQQEFLQNGRVNTEKDRLNSF